MQRTILCLTLFAAALGAAFLATHARRLGLRAESFAAVPGAEFDDVPALGDDLPAAPFRYAVVRAVRGDSAALAAAMDAIRSRGDVDFVVLRGDVLDVGDDDECRRIAAAFRDRGVPVIAAPGPNDRAHADAFQRWIGPLRWRFLHRGTTFDAAGFPADDAPPAASLAVEVRGAHGGVTETIGVVRHSAAGLRHSFALGVLLPLVRGTAAYAAVLCGCALVAGFAVTRLRPARPAAPTGTASRTAS